MHLKNIGVILITSVVLSGIALAQQGGWPLAKLTVHVVDEQGQSLAGASVKIWFSDPSGNVPGAGIGQSDTNGLFTAEGHSDIRLLSTASKTGFYDSGSSGTVFRDQKEGRWQPWNPVAEIIMRPIGKPVGLIVKSGWFDIPAVDEPCGYDLEKGDWVAPNGKGANADLIVTLKRRYVSRDDFEVTAEVRFASTLDGIQGVVNPGAGRDSVFKWQREAPETGYASVFRTRFAHTSSGYEQSADEAQNYFFRVRTVERDGHIVSALYGKIRGGLQLAPSNSKTSKIKLTYYLNPTPLDRNLEWDTQHNLLSGPSDPDIPREP